MMFAVSHTFITILIVACYYYSISALLWYIIIPTVYYSTALYH